MRLVFVFLNPEIRTGGHKRYLELAEGLGRKGHEVFFLKNGRLPERPEAVRVFDLVYPKKRFLPYSLLGLVLLFENANLFRASISACDCVVVFGETHLLAGMYLANLLSGALVFAYRSNGVEECAISFVENAGRWRKRMSIRLAALKYRLFERLVASRALLTVFQSEHDRASFLSRRGTPKTSTTVIRGNIGEPRFRAETADRNMSVEARRLLFVGSLNERKGILYLLDAAASLKKSGFSFTLDVIGFGELEQEVGRRVGRDFSDGSVRLLGRRKDPFPFLAEADLVVVPSLFDSYPNVVLEALHVGTPVVASRTGGIPDMLVHEELLFPPGDSAALAEKIRGLVENREAYARVKRLCAERKKDFLFDWPGEFEKAMLAALSGEDARQDGSRRDPPVWTR